MKKLIILGFMCVAMHFDVQGAAEKRSSDDQQSAYVTIDVLLNNTRKNIEKDIEVVTKSSQNKKEAILNFLQQLEKGFKSTFVKKYEAVHDQMIKDDLPWHILIGIKDANTAYANLIQEIKSKYIPSSRTCVIQ